MSKTSTNGGIGFIGLLTILLIGLKLTGYINWSWIWVLAPFWLPILILFIGIVLLAAISFRHAR